MGKLKIFAIVGALAVPIISGAVFSSAPPQICDGTRITSNCVDENGTAYSKFVFHEAEAEKTKEVHHPASPAKTHLEYHEPIYGTRLVPSCIETTIGYKNGTCALSRCRDGEYSGSSGRGTCSYHGGVWYGGGPWYEYVEEEYIITEGWYETVEDEPAKEAWTETVIISPAKEAYYEKVLAK